MVEILDGDEHLIYSWFCMEGKTRCCGCTCKSPTNSKMLPSHHKKYATTLARVFLNQIQQTVHDTCRAGQRQIHSLYDTTEQQNEDNGSIRL